MELNMLITAIENKQTKCLNIEETLGDFTLF